MRARAARKSPTTSNDSTDTEEKKQRKENIIGKVAVITGASSGLGEATARHLAAHGTKLVLGARCIDKLQKLSQELSLGANAAVQTDVTDRDQVNCLIDGKGSHTDESKSLGTKRHATYTALYVRITRSAGIY